MDLKKFIKVYWTLVFVELVLAVPVLVFRKWGFLLPMLIVFGVQTYYQIRYWRCPYCKKYLRNVNFAKYCCWCGEPLYGEDTEEMF